MDSCNHWSKNLSALSLVSMLLTGILTLATAKPAQAQAAYGSYVGIGIAFSPTEDSNGDGEDFQGVIAGRYRILESPISIRAQAFLLGDSSAIVPTISFDVPISWQTDVYLGAGIAFTGGDEPSVVGDTTSFVLQPGVDYILPNSNLVFFGNAVIAFDAYRNGDDIAASFQGGVGIQF
ncbi:MAG: porin family protein [Pseudanabaenales cyanobacterium]|nr:porin family protein [Pseudanabaenales cyanobacterium]